MKLKYNTNKKMIGKSIFAFIFGTLCITSCLSMEHSNIEQMSHDQHTKYYAVNITKRYRAENHSNYFNEEIFNYKNESILITLQDGILNCSGHADTNKIANEDGWEHSEFISVKKNCCPGKHECVHLNIPEGVKEIARNTFYRMCIDHVHLPEGIEKLGKYAFCDTILRGEIEIPPSVKTIEKGCFGYCNYIEEIKFNEGLVEIGELCCAHCYELKRFILPDSVKYIGDSICYKCNNVSEIKFPKNLTKFTGEIFTTPSILCSSPTFPHELTIILPDNCTCKFFSIKWTDIIVYRLEILFDNCKVNFLDDSIFKVTFKKCDRMIKFDKETGIDKEIFF